MQTVDEREVIKVNTLAASAVSRWAVRPMPSTLSPLEVSISGMGASPPAKSRHFSRAAGRLAPQPLTSNHPSGHKVDGIGRKGPGQIARSEQIFRQSPGALRPNGSRNEWFSTVRPDARRDEDSVESVQFEEAITRMHEAYMKMALELAEQAFAAGEVPVGAVITHEGRVIGAAYNQREQLRDPTAHAEMIAITQAAEAVANWRLSNCSLYVTLEPCPMCAGAILNSRISQVIFGAPDPKGGAVASVFKLLSDGSFEPPRGSRPRNPPGPMCGSAAAFLSETARKSSTQRFVNDLSL